MVYLKFKNKKDILKCSVVSISDTVVQLSFLEPAEINRSGFHVYIDEKAQLDIGGNAFEGYNTLYRMIDSNSFQLSNDGSIYTEQDLSADEIMRETLLDYIRQKKIEVYALKSQLNATDYIIIKAYEGNLVGKTLGEYDYESIHENRQAIRDEINVLQSEIDELCLKVEEI